MALTVIRWSKVSISLFAMLWWMSATAANDGDYHLTGIMGSESAKAFAVIEQADGQQHLLSEGSTIGSGYVGSISTKNKAVILVFPEGELFLSLTGSGKPDDYEEEYSIDNYTGMVEQNSLDQATIGKLLALSSNAENIGENELTTRLNSLLGLSGQARIAAYNEQEVESTRDLLQQLATQLPAQAEQGSYLGTLAVSDNSGSRRVYLMKPEVEGQ